MFHNRIIEETQRMIMMHYSDYYSLISILIDDNLITYVF